MISRELTPQESELITGHVWLIDRELSRLRKRLPCYVDFDEIRSAGNDGLIDAATKWTADAGVPFDSYGKRRVLGSMLDRMRKLDFRTKRERDRFKRLELASEEMAKSLGREVSPDEVCSTISKTKSDHLRNKLVLGALPWRSIDSQVGEGGTTLGELIADGQSSGAERLEEFEFEEALNRELEALSDQQKKVVALYYHERMRMAEIGEAMGLGESRICQIIKDTCATLRRRLKDYHEQRAVKKMAPVLPDARGRESAQCNRGLAVGNAWRDGDAGDGDGGLSTDRGEGRIAHSAEHDYGSDSHVLEDARNSGTTAADTGFLEHHIRDTNDAKYTSAMTDQALTRDSAWWHDFRAITQELEFWKGQAKAKQREIHRLNLLRGPRPTETDTSEVKPFVRSCRAHVAKPVLFAVAIAAACLCLVGCSAFGRVGRIKIPGTSLMPGKTEVKGVADAGTPPIVNTSAEETSLPLPAGTTIVETKTDAVPATGTMPAKPAAIVREIKLAADTTWIERAQKIQASAGTIDTSVAKHKADVASRMPLLWCAIACGIGALVLKSMLPQWPELSHGLFLGAGILFASWKFAEVPWWGALLAVGAVALLALGYKRGEWDKNGNNIPDFLEAK